MTSATPTPTFPDDDNGDALRRLQANGDDLTQPRIIDFVVIFADEASAAEFARRLNADNLKASVELTDSAAQFPWDVIVKQEMLPSHEEITNFETFLENAAGSLGGHNDGWGCFSQTEPRPPSPE